MEAKEWRTVDALASNAVTLFFLVVCVFSWVIYLVDPSNRGKLGEAVWLSIPLGLSVISRIYISRETYETQPIGGNTMITPWVREFLKAFERWSLWFAAPCLIIELLGLAVIGTRIVWLNPVLVVTGYMGLFIGVAFYISSLLTLSLFPNDSRRPQE